MNQLTNKGLAFLLLFIFLSAFNPYLNAQESTLIKVDKAGRLEYTPDEKGNTIPDFSHVGYHQGNKEIPRVPVVKTISSPNSGDSRQIIQDAIDEVANLKTDKNGFKGAILLKKGTYNIGGSIFIRSGGIVLRGEGTETRLLATGQEQRTLLRVLGGGSLQEMQGSRIKLKNKFVPVGSYTLDLETTEGLAVGDNIILFRPGTQKWITDIKMDQIIAREGTKQWRPEEYDLEFERKIIRIEGNQITMDNPVMMELDPQYGGGSVFKYTFAGRISEVGIEDMLFESEYEGDTDEKHGWIAVELGKIENGWVRNITSKYFGFACVSLNSSAKQITVRDSKCLDAKSVITGGRRYSFNNDGQLNLFFNLETTEGRHDYVTGAKVLGPNVFFNCKATNTHADIGPHHRWSVGTLYDNITTDGEINIQDRGNWGTGHGWAGVTQILWNCKAKRAAVQSPWVSGKNYSIGLLAEKYDGRLSGRPDAFWEGEQQHVLPASLYLIQLSARSIQTTKK
ncbi:hypothetical protein [Desertivirga xinjiangensis]|uniref:hypothetical protein n=1 Tax=Desertivirga xinjiangensis TaxID=539206 RepID=UPI00210B7958|nr:hypothetical protein [Pedobacter xinjiangensis]